MAFVLAGCLFLAGVACLTSIVLVVVVLALSPGVQFSQHSVFCPSQHSAAAPLDDLEDSLPAPSIVHSPFSHVTLRTHVPPSHSTAGSSLPLQVTLQVPSSHSICSTQFSPSPSPWTTTVCASPFDALFFAGDLAS